MKDLKDLLQIIYQMLDLEYQKCNPLITTVVDDNLRDDNLRL